MTKLIEIGGRKFVPVDRNQLEEAGWEVCDYGENDVFNDFFIEEGTDLKTAVNTGNKLWTGHVSK
jgi:hypothetical protein